MSKRAFYLIGLLGLAALTAGGTLGLVIAKQVSLAGDLLSTGGFGTFLFGFLVDSGDSNGR